MNKNYYCPIVVLSQVMNEHPSRVTFLNTSGRRFPDLYFFQHQKLVYDPPPIIINSGGWEEDVASDLGSLMRKEALSESGFMQTMIRRGTSHSKARKATSKARIEGHRFGISNHKLHYGMPWPWLKERPMLQRHSCQVALASAPIVYTSK